MTHSVDRNTWATPDKVFRELHEEFDFTVDACALPWNAKLPRFWSPEEDGLIQVWKGERIFCNPPYGVGMIQPWVKRAHEHWKAYPKNFLMVMLLPVRTSTRWFHDHCYHVAEIRFRKGRIQFVPPPGVTASTNREDSMIVIY